MDLRSGRIGTPYSELFEREDINTITDGATKILGNGDLFVNESNSGKILRGNATSAV